MGPADKESVALYCYEARSVFHNDAVSTAAEIEYADALKMSNTCICNDYSHKQIERLLLGSG